MFKKKLGSVRKIISCQEVGKGILLICRSVAYGRWSGEKRGAE